MPANPRFAVAKKALELTRNADAGTFSPPPTGSPAVEHLPTGRPTP
ncbi:hypothetical protein [Actinomyces trachealis]|nr:hypothetical protein [Actinomyces trachealis]